MAIEQVTFRVTGLSPLMQSNPACFITDEPDDQLKVKQKEYDADREAALRCYPKGGWSADGKKATGPYQHPAASFRRSMMNAVTGMKYGKKAARMVIAGAVFPVDEWVTILNGSGKPAKGYELDKRSVVIKSSKARVLRVRPKFWPWSCLLNLEIDHDWLTTEHVLEALARAGRIIGVGEFRPDPSDGKSGIGTFGRFKCEIA